MASKEEESEEEKKKANTTKSLVFCKALTAVTNTIGSSKKLKFTAMGASERYLAVGSITGGVYCFSHIENKFIQILSNTEGQVTALQFCPDDNYLAIATNKGAVIIWELNFDNIKDKAKRVKVMSSKHKAPVTCLQWAEKPMRVFSSDEAGEIFVVYLPPKASSKIVAGFVVREPELFYKVDSAVVQMDFAVDRLLVSTMTKAYILFWSPKNSVQVGTNPRDGPYGACFGSSLKNTLYACRPNLRIWAANATTGGVNATLKYQDLIASSSPSLILGLPSSMQLSGPHPSPKMGILSSLQLLDEEHIFASQNGVLIVFRPENASLAGFHTDYQDIRLVCTYLNRVFVLHSDALVLDELQFLDQPGIISMAAREGNWRLSCEVLFILFESLSSPLILCELVSDAALVHLKTMISSLPSKEPLAGEYLSKLNGIIALTQGEYMRRSSTLPTMIPTSDPQGVVTVSPSVKLATQSAFFTESVSSSPNTTIPEKVLLQPEPIFPQPEPAINQPEPVVSLPKPVVPQPELVVYQPEPVVSQLEPELVVSLPEPAINQPEPAINQPEPVVPQPEPVVIHPEPVVIHPEPVVSQPEPVVSQPEPVVPQPEPVVIHPEPVVIHPELAIPQPELVVPQPDLTPRSDFLLEPAPPQETQQNIIAHDKPACLLETNIQSEIQFVTSSQPELEFQEQMNDSPPSELPTTGDSIDNLLEQVHQQTKKGSEPENTVHASVGEIEVPKSEEPPVNALLDEHAQSFNHQANLNSLSPDVDIVENMEGGFALPESKGSDLSDSNIASPSEDQPLKPLPDPSIDLLDNHSVVEQFQDSQPEIIQSSSLMSDVVSDVVQRKPVPSDDPKDYSSTNTPIDGTIIASESPIEIHQNDHPKIDDVFISNPDPIPAQPSELPADDLVPQLTKPSDLLSKKKGSKKNTKGIEIVEPVIELSENVISENPISVPVKKTKKEKKHKDSDEVSIASNDQVLLDSEKTSSAKSKGKEKDKPSKSAKKIANASSTEADDKVGVSLGEFPDKEPAEDIFSEPSGSSKTKKKSKKKVVDISQFIPLDQQPQKVGFSHDFTNPLDNDPASSTSSSSLPQQEAQKLDLQTKPAIQEGSPPAPKAHLDQPKTLHSSEEARTDQPEDHVPSNITQDTATLLLVPPNEKLKVDQLVEERSMVTHDPLPSHETRIETLNNDILPPVPILSLPEPLDRMPPVSSPHELKDDDSLSLDESVRPKSPGSVSIQSLPADIRFDDASKNGELTAPSSPSPSRPPSDEEGDEPEDHLLSRSMAVTSSEKLKLKEKKPAKKKKKTNVADISAPAIATRKKSVKDIVPIQEDMEGFENRTLSHDVPILSLRPQAASLSTSPTVGSPQEGIKISSPSKSMPSSPPASHRTTNATTPLPSSTHAKLNKSLANLVASTNAIKNTVIKKVTSQTSVSSPVFESASPSKSTNPSLPEQNPSVSSPHKQLSHSAVAVESFKDFEESSRQALAGIDEALMVFEDGRLRTLLFEWLKTFRSKMDAKLDALLDLEETGTVRSLIAHLLTWCVEFRVLSHTSLASLDDLVDTHRCDLLKLEDSFDIDAEKFARSYFPFLSHADVASFANARKWTRCCSALLEMLKPVERYVLLDANIEKRLAKNDVASVLELFRGTSPSVPVVVVLSYLHRLLAPVIDSKAVLTFCRDRFIEITPANVIAAIRASSHPSPQNLTGASFDLDLHLDGNRLAHAPQRALYLQYLDLVLGDTCPSHVMRLARQDSNLVHDWVHLSLTDRPPALETLSVPLGFVPQSIFADPVSPTLFSTGTVSSLFSLQKATSSLPETEETPTWLLPVRPLPTSSKVKWPRSALLDAVLGHPSNYSYDPVLLLRYCGHFGYWKGFATLALRMLGLSHRSLQCPTSSGELLPPDALVASLVFYSLSTNELSLLQQICGNEAHWILAFKVAIFLTSSLNARLAVSLPEFLDVMMNTVGAERLLEILSATFTPTQLDALTLPANFFASLAHSVDKQLQQAEIMKDLFRRLDSYLWTPKNTSLPPQYRLFRELELKHSNTVAQEQARSAGKTKNHLLGQDNPSTKDDAMSGRPVVELPTHGLFPFRSLEDANVHWGVTTSFGTHPSCPACCKPFVSASNHNSHGAPPSFALLLQSSQISIFECGHMFHAQCTPQSACALCFVDVQMPLV